MKSLVTAAILVLMALLVCAREARAQVTGSIVGTVRDTAGAVIPGATVITTQRQSNVSRATTTNEAGEFCIPSLGPGDYWLTTELTGFKTVRRSIPVTGNSTSRVKIALEVGALEESVTIVGEALPLTVGAPGRIARDSLIVSPKDLRQLSLPRNMRVGLALLPGMRLNSIEDRFVVANQARRAHEIIRALADIVPASNTILITDALENGAYWKAVHLVGHTLSSFALRSSLGRAHYALSVDLPRETVVGNVDTFLVRLSRNQFEEEEVNSKPHAVHTVFVDDPPSAQVFSAGLYAAPDEFEITNVGPTVQAMMPDDTALAFRFRVKALKAGVRRLAVVVSEMFGQVSRVVASRDLILRVDERLDDYFLRLIGDSWKIVLGLMLPKLWEIANSMYASWRSRRRRQPGFITSGWRRVSHSVEVRAIGLRLARI